MSATNAKPAASTAPSPSAHPWPGTTAGGTARLEIDGKTLELPVVVGTEGERGIDLG